VLAPLLIVMLVLSSLGIATLLSALSVAYRDFRFVVPFAVQLWMFATPAVYLPVESYAGPRALTLLPLNPAQGLILNFRNAVLGRPLDGYSLAVSTAVGLAFCLAGCLYFRRVERSFADVI